MILAIDIGGTKTLVALFDHHGRLVRSQKIPTQRAFHAFMHSLTDFIRKEFWRPDITAIGVAVAGRINYQTHIVALGGNLPWENVDVAGPLHHEFKVPVVIDNDANAGGLAEARDLAHTPPHVLYITLGTGIGSGIITNSSIDPTFAQSEAGHIMLEYQGILQRWEDLASGRALYRDYQQKAYEISDPDIWEDYAHKLALGFFALIPVLQPDLIIIGGGVGAHFDKYGKLLHNKLRTGLPAIVPLPKIVQANNSEEAVTYGCFQLTQEKLAP